MSSTNNQISRVLIVDDSAFMRKVLSDILSSDPGIEVVDTARNGKEAIEKCKALHPDVITLDVEMPVMDGITCLKELLSIAFVPVIMLSSLTHEGAKATIEALELGAIDFITKPTGIFEISGQEKKKELIEKVKIAKNAVNIRRKISKRSPIRPKNVIIRSESLQYIVAIGTSTGGPKALQDVIPLIPGGVNAAFLVVQHMPAGFTKSLAERLNTQSEVTVKEAVDGEQVLAGYVYIAPGDFHMMVALDKDNVLKIRLTKDPPRGGHRPSVNTMMESLAETRLQKVIAVIMTGMGSDGSEGIVKIKQYNNGSIIAQDEKSCVVYGMPRVAAAKGIVDSVVPLKGIAQEILNYMGVL